MAAILGLTAALQDNRPGLPVRCLATDVMAAKDSLPSKTIYVGHYQVAISLDPWAQLRYFGLAGQMHHPHQDVQFVGLLP